MGSPAGWRIRTVDGSRGSCSRGSLASGPGINPVPRSSLAIDGGSALKAGNLLGPQRPPTGLKTCGPVFWVPPSILGSAAAHAELRHELSGRMVRASCAALLQAAERPAPSRDDWRTDLLQDYIKAVGSVTVRSSAGRRAVAF